MNTDNNRIFRIDPAGQPDVHYIFDTSVPELKMTSEKGEEKIHLEPSVYRFLRYFLLSRPGQVLTYEQIVKNTAKDPHADVDEYHYLFNHLAVLRKKKLNGVIENVSGFGARLCARVEDITPSEQDNLGNLGQDLRATASEEIRHREESLPYTIEEALLLLFTWQNRTEPLEQLLPGLQPNGHRYCLCAPGGSGKTASLIHACRIILKTDRDLIPIFIPARELGSGKASSEPVSEYLFQHYSKAEYQDEKRQSRETIAVFRRNIQRFMAEQQNRVRVLIALDGVNELSGNMKELVFEDLKRLEGIPGVIVLISSRMENEWRLGDEIILGYDLTDEAVRNYLARHHIGLAHSLGAQALHRPFFLRMFAEAGDSHVLPVNGLGEDESGGFTGKLVEAGMINRWVERQVALSGPASSENGRETSLMVRIFLPLFAVAHYLREDPADHRSMRISSVERKAAMQDVLRYFTDESVLENLVHEGFDVDRCTQVTLTREMKRVLMDRLAFLSGSGADDVWTHEIFRDFFTARGLCVLWTNSEETCRSCLEKFNTETFVFPESFSRNDYPSFVTGVYFVEMVGGRRLTEQPDRRVLQFLKNLVFYADCVICPPVTFTLAPLILAMVGWGRDGQGRDSTDENSLVSGHERSSLYSSLAYCMMHALELDGSNAEEERKVLHEAKALLEEARKQTRERLASGGGEKEEKLLARICGNLGMYWMDRFLLEKAANGKQDKAFTVRAWDCYREGADIKKNLLERREQSGSSAEIHAARNDLAGALQNLGENRFFSGDYEQAVSLYEKALSMISHQDTDSPDRLTLRWQLLRSRFCLLEKKQAGSEAELREKADRFAEMIREEAGILDGLEKWNMIGEFDMNRKLYQKMLKAEVTIRAVMKEQQGVNGQT